MSLDVVKFLEGHLEDVEKKIGSCLYDYQSHAACISHFPSFLSVRFVDCSFRLSYAIGIVVLWYHTAGFGCALLMVCIEY